MAMNKYMHPRNIYKTSPNFKHLALKYPEFQKFVKQDITGKVSFDFKNIEALRALCCTLLKNDFDLNIEIPLNRLIPTVPLRLNYILWLEDLLNVTGINNNVKGIDIGTGASCIYPLLAARKNKWSMLATETDKENFYHAINNVKKNNLDDLIKVIRVQENSLLTEIVEGDNCFNFCMTNPPFFGSTKELSSDFKARNPSRPHPKNSFCAATNEVVVEGGEVSFIKKLVEESAVLKEKIKIYSTMIGHKSTVPKIKIELRKVNVASFCETEFCQGNTTRWGLAWTFCKEFDLRKCPDPVKQALIKEKHNKPLCHKITVEKIEKSTLITICNDILELFKKLQMSVKETLKGSSYRSYIVKAFSNTWSHQRRKKRQQRKISEEFEEQNTVQEGYKSPNKRSHEDTLDEYLTKKLKIDESDEDSIFFKFEFSIIQIESEICLELKCCENYENRECLHQILQYIKNNYKAKM